MPSMHRPATFFFDFDSTIITKESLDEVISYALTQRPERDHLMKEIEEITTLGMEGQIPFTQSVARRISIVSLSRTDFNTVGEMLTRHITTGMHQLFSALSNAGHTVSIVSGGFRETILPTAHILGVPPENVMSNCAVFDTEGSLASIDTTSPLWTDAGKTKAIQEMTARIGTPVSTVLIGDGVNDLAAYTAGAVDIFIGFGGVIAREKLQREAPQFAYSSAELLDILINANFVA